MSENTLFILYQKSGIFHSGSILIGRHINFMLNYSNLRHKDIKLS